MNQPCLKLGHSRIHQRKVALSNCHRRMKFLSIDTHTVHPGAELVHSNFVFPSIILLTFKSSQPSFIHWTYNACTIPMWYWRKECQSWIVQWIFWIRQKYPTITICNYFVEFFIVRCHRIILMEAAYCDVHRSICTLYGCIVVQQNSTFSLCKL